LQKLDMDLAAPLRLRHAMDDDTDGLIALLCTRIGAIMEDASVVVLTIGHCEPGQRGAALPDLEQASARISALLGATKALLD